MCSYLGLHLRHNSKVIQCIECLRASCDTWCILLHDLRDIECKYGFLERKHRAILHGSTTGCTAASARGQTTVKRGRINGGKLILSLIYLCNCRIININLLYNKQQFVSPCGLDKIRQTRKNIQPYWTCVITYIYDMVYVVLFFLIVYK